jgi:hypothetical protein
MSPRTITVISALALAAGVGVVAQATWRVHVLDERSASLAEAGRVAGDSFVETLQGEQASRLFEAFDRRRQVALARADARLNRLFGVLLAVAGGIGLATGSAFRRMAEEIAEEQLDR